MHILFNRKRLSRNLGGTLDFGTVLIIHKWKEPLVPMNITGGAK